MNDVDRKCLDAFPVWLRTLADDAQSLSATVGDSSAPDAARRYAAAALNYLFKSLDLISDGIEDLGYIDDAFVLRVAAALAVAEAPDTASRAPKIAALAGDAKLIASLLGGDHARLESYVKKLKTSAARGRTVDDILGDDDVRRDFLNEVSGWCNSYEVPTFTRDEKNLVKLKSFLSSRLP